MTRWSASRPRLVLDVSTGRCDVRVGARLASLKRLCGRRRVVVVTDATVRRLWSWALPPFEMLTVGVGERAKSLDTVRRLYGRFLAMGLDRSALVVGVGGGAVCDVTGFAAATYKRGLDVAFVPTTLLAQADAAIGGKNGVNLDGYKNLVGLVRQPRFVLSDPAVLATLPARQVRHGLAEIVKAAVLDDGELFDLLERRRRAVLTLDRSVLREAVGRAVAVKVRVVKEDDQDRGARHLLNLGHTVGHAVEKAAGLAHGDAVSVGLVAEARLAVEMRRLNPADLTRIERLLAAFGLPTACRASPAKLLDAIAQDKKRRGGRIRMPILSGIGEAALVDVGLSVLEGVLHAVR